MKAIVLIFSLFSVVQIFSQSSNDSTNVKLDNFFYKSAFLNIKTPVINNDYKALKVNETQIETTSKALLKVTSVVLNSLYPTVSQTSISSYLKNQTNQ